MILPSANEWYAGPEVIQQALDLAKYLPEVTAARPGISQHQAIAGSFSIQPPTFGAVVI
jgi:hypothetical protein